MTAARDYVKGERIPVWTLRARAAPFQVSAASALATNVRRVG
jgi:hypothetical protein